MAITITNVVSDNATVKVFDILVPEADVIGVDNGFVTFGSGGLRDFDLAPMVKWVVNITPAGDAPTNTTNISIYGPTIFGFRCIKTSVAAGAVNQTYRVYMYSKSFFAF